MNGVPGGNKSFDEVDMAVILFEGACNGEKIFLKERVDRCLQFQARCVRASHARVHGCGVHVPCFQMIDNIILFLPLFP